MKIVVVKKGDTLYSIAKENNISTQTLIKSNQLTNPDNLVIGQTIVIPQDSKKLGGLAVNGYLYPNIKREVLNEALSYLTFLTIFTYGFDENGDLISPQDEEIIKIALENNVKPIMLISTLNSQGTFSNYLSSQLLNNKDLQDKLINNILKTLKEKKYFGLDIDFEYIFPNERQQFIEFIQYITDALNKEGFPVITALAPKTSSEQKGLLYEAHDYKAIGEASNAVLLNITDALNKEGFPVITALAPKTSSEQKGLLYEAHDYKAIGEASNAVLLMTYEWGYT